MGQDHNREPAPRPTPDPTSSRGFGDTFVVPMLIVFPIPVLALLFAIGPMDNIAELREQARLIALLAAALLGSSLGAIVLVASCVALSARSQRMQFVGLNLSWLLLRPTGIFQVVGQGALAVALSYYVTAVLFGYVYPKLVLGVGCMVLVGVVGCIAGMFRTGDRPEEMQGRRLDPAQLGKLGERLERICTAMGQRMPDNIIVGIDDNFFVTETPITIGGKTWRGRSLFLSLPLLGRLGLDEASAVFAHEMAHFSGNDTAHGRRIGPLLNSFDAQLRAMHGGMAHPVFRFMLFFRALFELSLGKVGRERELRADRIAAQLVDGRALGLALAKVSAFCAFRAKLESDIFLSAGGLGDGRIGERLAAGFERFVSEVDIEEDILPNQAAHPFDRHPSLADRLAALGLDCGGLRREEIAALPAGTWRDAIVDAPAIESALWADYESEFRIAHEQLTAYRLRPDNEAEAAIVRKHFPDRVIEGAKDSVLAIDFASLSFSEWRTKLAFKDIRSMQVVEGFAGNRLVITMRGRGRTVELPLGRFGREAQAVVTMIGAYFGRHLESASYCAAHKKPVPASAAPRSSPAMTPAAIVRPPGDRPDPPAPGGDSGSPAAIDVSAPVPAPAPAPAEVKKAPIQAPRPAPSPVPTEPGVLNGRYELVDRADDWEPGRLQRCHDRKGGETVLCVNAGPPLVPNPELLARIQAAASLRLPGLTTPIRVLQAGGYRPLHPGDRLHDGDVVLVFPDAGAQPILAARLRSGPAATDLSATLRILRPLGEILDAAATAGIDLARLDLDQIRIDPERRVRVYLAGPWCAAGTDAGQDLVLDPAHPRNGDPATITAALAAMLLADPADLRLHVCHGGLHRTIPGIPAATNRLLARQLGGEAPPPHRCADAFLDDLQANHRVHLESYLSPEQLAHLRERCALDDEGVLAVVRSAVLRTRPGTDLFCDQSPARLQQRDLDAAIASRNRRQAEDVRGVRLAGARRWLGIGTGAATVLVLLLWWFSNDGSEPAFQPSQDGAQLAQVRAVFTRDWSYDASFPGRCYRHMPSRNRSAAFYAQVSELTAGGNLELSVVSQNGRQLGQYTLAIGSGSGWAFVGFPVNPATTSVTGQVRLNGHLLHEVTIPVADSWFDGFGRAFLTLVIVWALAGAVAWQLPKRL